MVMSNDNFQADVVFLIEATAHISPYVESLKTNYIVPTLEYFSGGSFSDDRDFGGDANPNSTLYGIVSFMSNDCRPDSASVCYAPTSNSGTFLQWLDKIQFIGGAGSTSSHIVEGLSTAINLLDDFQTFREKSSDTLNRTLKSSKHCILICNSTPYFEPVVENPIYCGYSIDQLMKVMNEKNINFSIFSPRKIQFLYKLFENAGGSLPNALTKNYAKDRRHLVLLNGFHLQEKPMSPSSQPPSTEHTGLKRPLSPTSNSQPMLPNPQMRNSQLSSLIANESAGTPFGQHPKLAGDMGSIQPRGGSPWPANGSVPSPSQGPRNPNMTPVRARATTPQMASANLQSMNPAPSPGQLPNLVPQASPASKPVQMNPGNVTLRPNNPNMNQIRPQQMQSPFPAPQAPSPSQPQPSPMGMRAVPSPIQNSAPSPISQPQQFIQQQQINQISQQHQQQQQQLTPMNSQGSNAMNMPVNSTVPTMRTRIWSGIIEYYDKQPPTMNKMMYHLECQITYQHNNNEPEFSSQGWPEKMLINTVPKLLINRLSPIFKNNSYHVNLHFNNDSPGLQKLLKAMSANSVGCIQLPNPANIRIIIILYMPDKKMFVGFIPHNQDEFMTSMKELIESHKKEQAVKQQQQKMLSHMQMANAMGHQQQMQQQQQQGQVAVNQAPNAQPQLAPMGGPLSIQLSHGQMAQAGQSGAGQIMPPNSANTMFQLQQMNNNQSLGSNQNANIGGGSAGPGPSAQVPMSQASTTGASPGGGMLLNQTLSGISNANQPKNSVLIGNTSANGNQMTATTTNGGAGMQITLNSTANNGGQMQQANLPPLGQQQQQQKQIMQQNVPTHQVSGQQQQFNMMANSQQQQLNMRPSAGGGGAGAAAGFGQNANEREQNLMAIKQLEQTLKEAQKKEMEYQLQHSQQDPPKPGQMIASASLQQQPQQNNAVRQHLQHQLQQKQQMIHMQQQQQQQQQQQHQVNINSNLQQQQLRHLLQQQQLRSINPSARMQGTVSHQQPQQSQIMLQQQGGPMAQQQQQFRFQAQQQPAQQATAQQHGRNFFDEY